jgi:hypothetical protein
MNRWYAGLTGIVLGIVACGAPRTDVPLGATPAAAQTADTTDLMVPPRLGTLRQDDITIQLRNGPLLLKVTPLDEATIRLLAPDTYDRLHAIAESRRTELQNRMQRTAEEMFLVSFFSYEADIEFQPEGVELSHQGRLLQPIAILPVTSGWGRQRLNQQDQQVAVYAFGEPIDYRLRLVIRYGATDSDAWTTIIPKLDSERAKVRARAGDGSER